MAVGYQYREVNNFIELQINREWRSTTQLMLPGVGDNQEDLHSIIRYLGESEHRDYRKYQVTHETVKSLRVRFHDEIRTKVIAIEEFSLYLSRSGDHLLASANKIVVNELMRRIQERNPDFKYAERVVDLRAVSRELVAKGIRGGWFGKLDIVDVSTAAVFGPNVSESDDWRRYETSGEISLLMVELPSQADHCSVNIARNGTVVVLANFSEKNSLEIVKAVSELIAPHVEVIKDW